MRSVTHALSRAQRNGSEAVWMANITPGPTSKMGINFRSLLRTAPTELCQIVQFD